MFIDTTNKFDFANKLPTLCELSSSLKERRISPLDLVSECFLRIKKLNPKLNSFISIYPEDIVLEKAKKCEQSISNHQYIGQLHGIPYSVKDIIRVKGLKFTSGSNFNPDNISSKNAFVVNRLDREGALLIGTNNLNEFASGITGKNSVFGDSKNPHDLSRISGGSSGGSAVAVSTGMVVFAIGTDTGGSIRVPSSLCGVVGLKPSYNSISMKRILQLAPSLDHVGIIARCVEDSFLVFDVLKNKTKQKPKTTFRETDSCYRILNSAPGIGYPENYFLEGLEKQVPEKFYDLLEVLDKEGYITKKIHFDKPEEYYPDWKTVRLFEAAKVHSRRLRVDTGQISSDVKKMLIEGNNISEGTYLKAKTKIRDTKRKFKSILNNECALLVMPTTLITAPHLRSIYYYNYEDDAHNSKINKSLTRDLLLRNTIIFNSIGFPALTLPINWTKRANSRLPIGLQLVSAPFKESILMNFGMEIEKLFCRVDSI